MGYGADVGRAHAISAAFAGGKAAGRKELIEELEQPCTEHLKYTDKRKMNKHECTICYKEITNGQ
jgi:hypothetical protein